MDVKSKQNLAAGALRPLTMLEQQFVKEAEAGHFAVLRHEEDGHPYAMGARKTGNLFSMDVIEIDDPFNEGSIYELNQPE